MAKLPTVEQMKFRRYPPLKSGPPILWPNHRYFRRNEGSTDYATHTSVTVDRIVMDVLPNTGNGNLGLPTGAPAVTDNVLQTIDFTYSGSISELYRNGSDYFSGIIANVKYYLAGELVHYWKINSNANTEADLVSGAIMTIINGNASDWGLFDRQANGDWLGQELIVNGGFDSDISGWSDAFNGAGSYNDGSILIANSSAIGGSFQTISTLIGASYNFSGLSIGGAIDRRLRAGNGGTPDAGISDSNVTTSGGYHSGSFIAESSVSYMYMRLSGTGSVGFDNVSVKEVLKNA